MIFNKYEILAEIARVEAEITRIDNGDWSQEEYEQFLDEVFPVYEIGNIKFYPSDIFKSCDPIAFDMSLFEHFDSVLSDLRSELKDLQENLVHAENWLALQAFI